MKVNEIFYSLQGEGSSIGIPSIFVRLAGCNIACSFCDSKYALAGEYEDLDISTVVEKIRNLNCKNVVITGGEPLLQYDEVRELCNVLKHTGHTIEIETNGTIPPGVLAMNVDRWHVSVKLNNSQVNLEHRVVKKVIEKFASMARMGQEVEFKFVLGKKEDIFEMLDLCNTHSVPFSSVVVMPCAISREGVIKVMEELAPLCLDYTIRLLPRMHVLLWGNKRGV